MNELKTFDFETQAVRAVTIDGEPWFVGKDVCVALAIGDHKQALARLDEDERSYATVRGGLGGYNVPPQVLPDVGITDVSSDGPEQGRQMTVIAEAGVYRLIFTSRTDAAERFKRWLAHEVLPALRRTGSFELRPLRSVEAECPVEDMKVYISLVNCYRHVYGRHIAGLLIKSLPLPQIEAMVAADLSDDENYVSGFLAAMMPEARGAKVPARRAYIAYLEWCDENGVQAASEKGFAISMERLGVAKRKGRVRQYLNRQLGV